MKPQRISFSTECVAMPGIDQSTVREWLSVVADNHGFKMGRLGYVFCDDETILRVNREFLGHDYYTDIITFDYTSGDVVSGDMYISLDTVATNAVASGESYVRELHRVIAHGLLHLCGINDKGPGEREIMEANENDALELLSSKFHVNC